MIVPKTMTSSAIVLLVITGICWLLLMAALSTVVGATSIGDRDIFLGLRWIFAGVMVGVMSLCLGGMFLMAGGQGALPGWVNIAALVLIPLSAAAAMASLYMVSETFMRWPLAIPVAAPVLLAAYFVMLYRQPAPSLHQAVWGAVALLSLSIWPAVAGHFNDKAAAKVESAAAQTEWDKNEKARIRTENLAKLETMSTDQHIADWLTLLSKDGGVREEALAKFRTAPRRQADVEEGLGYGIPAFMQFVPELDLQPTPKLCELGKAYLLKIAKDYRLKDRDPISYETQFSIDGAVPAIRWFESHGCNCDEGIAAIRTVVMTYLDSPARQKLLGNLSAK